MNESFNKPPIKSDLELAFEKKQFDVDYAGKEIYKLSDNPNTLIREFNLKDLDFFDLTHSLKDLNSPEGIEGALEYIQKYKNFLSELSETYNIQFPKFDFFIGTDGKGEQKIFTRVEKIEGISLESLKGDFSNADLSEKSQEEVKSKIQQLCINLTTYYSDKITKAVGKNDTLETTGQVYVYDLLRHSQYVYGHELNSDKWGLYNIDIDPYLGTFSVLEPGGLLNAFLELCAAIQLYKKSLDLMSKKQKYC